MVLAADFVVFSSAFAFRSAFLLEPPDSSSCRTFSLRLLFIARLPTRCQRATRVVHAPKKNISIARVRLAPSRVSNVETLNWKWKSTLKNWWTKVIIMTNSLIFVRQAYFWSYRRRTVYFWIFNSLRHGILGNKRISVCCKFCFYKIQQSWFILTSKKAKLQNNTKMSKKSFKFLIIVWDLNSSFVPYLRIKKVEHF